MTRMVQVAVAGDVTEAEELESMPQKVLVPESSLEAAMHAIESLSDPDDLVSDA